MDGWKFGEIGVNMERRFCSSDVGNCLRKWQVCGFCWLCEVCGFVEFGKCALISEKHQQSLKCKYGILEKEKEKKKRKRKRKRLTKSSMKKKESFSGNIAYLPLLRGLN